jgi:GNAT superfamily N-acetyltransferase
VAKWRIPERWEWQYASNPFWGHQESLPIFIAIDRDSRVVAQSCVMAVPFSLQGKDTIAGWGCDLFVEQQWRGAGVATRLQRMVHAATEVHLSLNMAGETRRIKQRLGDAELAAIPVYELTIRYASSDVRSVLERRLPVQLPDGILSGTSNSLARIASLAQRWRGSLRPRSSEIVLREGKGFAAEHTTLWKCIAPFFEASVTRSAEYLAWKIAAQPHMRYRSVEAWREGELVGYVVFRSCTAPEAERGRIVDVVAMPDDRVVIRTLLAEAVRLLAAAGAPKIQIATTVTDYAAMAQRLGFRRVYAMPSIIGLAGRDGDSVSELSGRSLLSLGDGDWDQFPSTH